LQAELIRNLLRPRQAMERFVRRKMRCVHPLLNFLLMTFRALIRPNDLGGIAHRRTNLTFFAMRHCATSAHQAETNEQFAHDREGIHGIC